MKFRGFMLIMVLGASISATGQYSKEFKRVFFEAGSLYQIEFYEEAFSRYKNLLSLDPGNSNILFHCGACCLKIPGNEKQAVTFFEEAVPGVTPEYKNNSHKESGAPVLTYFMLGKACHLNNEFNSAIENYERYLEAGEDEDPLQLDYTRLQIDASKRADRVVKEAPAYEFQSVLDHFDDDLPSCNNPVISGDGNILIFLVDYPNDKKIMMTQRTGQLWSRPRVINSEIGLVGETYPVSLSYDGLDLYIAHQFYSHSDIFVSRFNEGRWSGAEALGHNINGRTSETHASISKDGKTLYFTSDARGGQGSYDIFVSRLDGKGEWGLPANLGPVINTPYEEHTPFISSNDSILFFSSQGHASIGGIDVYFSELGSDGSWGKPQSLGYPVNTTGENTFFNPGWDELNGIYAVRRDDDPTSNTINMVIKLEQPEEVADAIQPENTSAPPGVAPAPRGGTSGVTPVVTSGVTPGVAPASQEVSQSSTVYQTIEPEETDEIHEVLNRGVPPATVSDQPPATASTRPLLAAAGSTRLETSVPFEYNAFKLSMAAMLEVEKLAELMQTYPETSVRLTGHADATGPEAYNLLLSHQRVDQIYRYLEMRGIDPARVFMEGKGEKAPVARNSYPDGTDAPLGRYLNRHVTVTIESPAPIQAPLAGFYVPASLTPDPDAGSTESSSYWFTIQFFASKVKLHSSKLTKLEGVKEYLCKDDLYRYTVGAYRTFGEAKHALDNMQDSGYPDAFIQTVAWYDRAAGD